LAKPEVTALLSRAEHVSGLALDRVVSELGNFSFCLERGQKKYGPKRLLLPDAHAKSMCEHRGLKVCRQIFWFLAATYNRCPFVDRVLRCSLNRSSWRLGNKWAEVSFFGPTRHQMSVAATFKGFEYSFNLLCVYDQALEPIALAGIFES